MNNEDCTDISAEAAIAIMDSAQFRLVVHQDPPVWGGDTWNEPEIFHEGKWKTLCRTDYFDDVATGWCTTKTLDEWVAHYRAKLEPDSFDARYGDFGARFNDRRFSIIDAATDG